MQDVPIPDATRPDPIDPGEQGTGDPAQQAHGERGVLAGTVCWLPTAMRCVCCILRMWRRRRRTIPTRSEEQTSGVIKTDFFATVNYYTCVI